MVKTLPTGTAQGVTDIVARAQLIFERRPMPETVKKTPANNRWKPASKRTAEKAEPSENPSAQDAE
ncbi:hypothetical protein [Microvirga pudoricolor]|uniref:hypothetical protein n=1 Tax=Microvirga pudoricolor TaxID=2778729 RepID=UPI001951316C|nr:hypothetical protein [Microvirga pudoricolor]MBM6595597.1 hypothetical protein [Microvirga pudoricolor]